MTERLKHRHQKMLEVHFKKLCEYWSLKPIQRAKEGKEPTQAEVFVETRKGNKGKKLDVETEKAIAKLQEMVEIKENDTEAFEVVFGKEHTGISRRCIFALISPLATDLDGFFARRILEVLNFIYVTFCLPYASKYQTTIDILSTILYLTFNTLRFSINFLFGTLYIFVKLYG
ncbi:unnamed protein product [Trifolium pratense]|uniref:Uncharacterized protein n=1 Tax=Trifolium pratense TaxID=57577 RepID=A0ACB0IJN9_TRIPR|nr:unnamed protein product [Trifolium pratense]